MAKADRNAVARASVTGENYKQALHWLREHGLTHGAVPDAEDPGQQVLEAALLFALARAAGPLGTLKAPHTLFGIAKSSPSPRGLILWPAPGSEEQVLARLLPARSPDGVIRGVPGLRWNTAERRLALSVPDHAGRVLVAASARNAHAAGRLAADAGLDALAGRDVSAEEEIAWRERILTLQSEAPSWSRALRRPVSAHAQLADMARQAPNLELLAGDEDALGPRPHGPAAFRSTRVVHVRSRRGGEGTSTVSVQLAYGLARTGTDVALVTDDWVLPPEADHAPADEVWRSVDVPSGAGRLRAADGGQYREELEARATEALQYGRFVVLDVGSEPVRGLPAADLTFSVGRYARWDWIRAEVIDRRPARIQAYDRLDQLFDGAHRAPETDELTTLLSALDHEFVAHTCMRLDGDGADEYDPQDKRDVEEWWDLFNSPVRNAEDILPAEDSVPLTQWRRDLLDAIDAEARRRLPGTWERARSLWPEHNQHRNLQRLGTAGDTLGELAVQLDDFLSALDESPDLGGTDERRTWHEGRLARWLEERFAAHLAHDAALLPQSDEDRLVSLLDAHFLPEIPTDTLQAESAQDWWWDTHAAVRQLLAGDYWPLDPHDGDPAEEHERFLRTIDAEGLRRHPATWPHVREYWAEHHAERAAAHREPFQPEPGQLPTLRRAFTKQLRDAGVTQAVPGWEAVAERWAAGKHTDAERVREFAHLLDQRLHPADPGDVADTLAREVRALNLRVGAPTAMVVTFHRSSVEAQSVSAVSDALVSHGIAGVRTVPQLRLLEWRLFEPVVWNNPRVRDLQTELAELATEALQSASGSERTPG